METAIEVMSIRAPVPWALSRAFLSARVACTTTLNG